MNRKICKFKMVGGVSSLIIKGEKGQHVSEREVYAINNGEVAGLLPVQSVPRGLRFELIFDLLDGVTLADFLAEPITHRDFATLLRGILEVLQATETAVFEAQSLVLDMNYIMMDPQTGKPNFLYVPIARFDSETDLRSLLMSIAQYAVFDPEEDLSYLDEFDAIISEGASFSRFALEEYLHKLENRKEPERPVRICSACGQTVAADFLFCPECGGRTVEQAAPQTVPEVPQSPHLFRERTGQWLQVAQPECTIGKSVSRNTCPITDNPTVSRLHAAITLRGDRFYAVDRGSTNGTWINGNRLEPHLEVPLAIGDSIKIADEMFYFQMK